MAATGGFAGLGVGAIVGWTHWGGPHVSLDPYLLLPSGSWMGWGTRGSSLTAQLWARVSRGLLPRHLPLGAQYPTVTFQEGTHGPFLPHSAEGAVGGREWAVLFSGAGLGPSVTSVLPTYTPQSWGTVLFLTAAPEPQTRRGMVTLS